MTKLPVPLSKDGPAWLSDTKYSSWETERIKTYLKRERITPGLGEHVFRILGPTPSLLYRCKTQPEQAPRYTEQRGNDPT